MDRPGLQLGCVLLAAVAGVVVSGTAAAQLLGDVNCDGRVTVDDVSTLNAVMFGDALSDCGEADVNADARVASADVVALLQVLGKPLPFGPVVTYIGAATASGIPFDALGEIDGAPVFFSGSGSGFKLVIEARQGLSGLAPGVVTFHSNPHDPTQRPDLQIESSAALGDGSRAVCVGGVPQLNPPDFGPTQVIADALNDFACNFVPATAPDFGCTVDAFGNNAFVANDTQAQFCLQVSVTLAFPLGDTLLTVQLRDRGGNLGPRQQVLMRVASGPVPPTFTATPTLTAAPPTPTRTWTPTRSPTLTPTATATRTATPLPTVTASRTVTPSATHTAGTPTPSPTPFASPSPTATRPSPTPTRTATPSASPQPSMTPSRTSTPSRTATATRTPTPTPTASPTAASGPVVSYLGLTQSDDTLVLPDGPNPDGIPIFSRLAASGFHIVVEGKPGADRAAVGQCAIGTSDEAGCTPDPASFPDLQIESSNPLGNGSPAVCDRSGANAGGVPGVFPADFTPTQTNINIVDDLACRFLDGSGAPLGRPSTDGCVLFSSGQEGYANPQSKMQFCMQVESIDQFPVGDTILTARLRDVNGNVGAPAQIVVHIGP